MKMPMMVMLTRLMFYFYCSRCSFDCDNYDDTEDLVVIVSDDNIAVVDDDED